VNPRAFGRHKAAASIAQGFDPGSYLTTGTAKPKGWKRKRGRTKAAMKRYRIIQEYLAMPRVEMMIALKDCSNEHILRACGIKVPESISKKTNRNKRPRMKLSSGSRSLSTSFRALGKRKPHKPCKWKTGGRVRRSPDPIESTVVNAEVISAETGT